MTPTAHDDTAGPVTTVELFFDLVFVFTITQLTGVIADDPTAGGVARSLVIFGNLWWMYGGYAWLTNTVTPHRDRERLLLLLGMAAFLVAALAVPDGFGRAGVALGAGYLLVNAVHAWMLLGRMEGSVLRAMGRLGPFNMGTAALILAAGFTGGTVTWALWIAAFALHWLTPYLTEPTVVALRSRHFVERHGLILVIALGESVLAVGYHAAQRAVSGLELVTAISGLVVVANLWWLYFDHDEDAVMEVFARSDGARRSWLALHAYGYGFLPVLGGIIVFAAGLRGAALDPGHHASTATAVLVGVGLAVYLAGLAGIRARLRVGPVRAHVALAVLAPVSIALGRYGSSLAQLLSLCVLLTGANVVVRHLDRATG